MRILLIHSDFIEYEPKEKAMPVAEHVARSKVRVEDCLVAFCSAEAGDDDNVAKDSAHSIKEVAEQVKTKRIVVYPFVHLSTKPAPAATALDLIKKIAAYLEKDYDVHRAPFGWYKTFDIKCKGHPLSELSREITPGGAGSKVVKAREESVSEAVKKEETIKSSWFIIEPGGREHRIELRNDKIDGFDFYGHAKLEKLCRYEMAKSRIVDKEPPHIKLMKKLELVNYEEGSDPGNFRFMPKGRLIKSLLEEFVTNETIKYGALEVETPIMYDYEHPALKNYLNRFPARQYTIVTPNKRVFLRFSACFGQFLMAHDANISYRNLPLPLYELTKYSYRVEQRGELAGLRRLRTFTMPDCHCLCRDFDQAKEQLQIRFDLAAKVMHGFGLSAKNDLEFAVRVTQEFYDEHKDFVHTMIKKWGRPALVEIWDKRFFYFVFKYEFNFIDALDKAATLTTDQIDIENGERFGISYVDADNRKKHPLILHLSPSGAIERVIYAMLEKAQLEQDSGREATLPMWLSPTQVRLCPVNDTFNIWAEELAKEMESDNIRADVDDRGETIGRKVQSAETEWVPLIVVLGNKEKESGRLPVRFRGEKGKITHMTIDEIKHHVRELTKEYPYKPLSLPRLLTKRPLFN
jgi:threonyl-tRNA synthetase